MITAYILAKTVHIITMVFFIGVVTFRTFIMPSLKSKYDKKTYMDIDNIIGMKARSIIKVNNVFLILSGLYLLSFHLDTPNLLLHVKVTIATILALSFYIVPIIMKKFKHITWFSMTFHYLFFSSMMLVVVLSQLMFAYS